MLAAPATAEQVPNAALAMLTRFLGHLGEIGADASSCDCGRPLSARRRCGERRGAPNQHRTVPTGGRRRDHRHAGKCSPDLHALAGGFLDQPRLRRLAETIGFN